MKHLNRFAVGFLVVFGVWLLSLALDAYMLPRLPANIDPGQLSDLRKDLEALVDRQWSRPGSVPVQQDLDDYTNFIDTVTRLDRATMKAHSSKVDELAENTSKRYEALQVSGIRFYQYWQPVIGAQAAGVITELLYKPRMAVLEHRSALLKQQSDVLNAPSRLLIDARYQYATALLLAGQNKQAVQQLRHLIKDFPQYALVNWTYMVGARCDALSDPDFCNEFDAIGGDLERLRKDYVQRGVKLYPIHLWGYQYRNRDYPQR